MSRNVPSNTIYNSSTLVTTQKVDQQQNREINYGIFTHWILYSNEDEWTKIIQNMNKSPKYNVDKRGQQQKIYIKLKNR